MIPAWLQPLLDWITQNPAWSGVIVFLIAMSESMLIIGGIIPGALLMLSLGALIALGALELWSTLFWCILGAIVGDQISYWIGYYFKDYLERSWPFSRYPQMLERGRAFFLKHGGKSIAFGRFVGPVRAVVPTVAGMMGMSPWRFTAVNVISAIGWAPCYIFPGIVLGTSLGLASQVATRLGILLAASLLVIWLSFWSVRRAIVFIQPRASNWLDAALAWGRSHPRLGRLATSLLDPERPEAAALTALAMVLLFVFWLLFALVVKTALGMRLAGIDEWMMHVMQSLRAPLADEIMVAISQFGDKIVTVPLMGAVLGYLAWRRYWLAAAHWLGAVVFAGVVTVLLKQWLSLERPMELFSGTVSYAFPSGHTAVMAVIFGFFAVMVAHALPRSWRWIPYTLAAALVSAVAFARLYLGAHWLSDVLGGFLLGLIWTALLGVGYRRHARQTVPVAPMLAVALASYVLVGGWHVAQHHDQALARYTPRPVVQHILSTQWWDGDWQLLPSFRNDLKGEPLNPLTVQWAGNLRDIKRQLEARGWHVAQGLTAAHAMMSLMPEPTADQLPVLPKIHNGRHEALTMSRISTGPAGGKNLLLRLWPADLVLSDRDLPVWVGYVAYLEVARFPLFSFARSQVDAQEPLQEFREELTTLRAKTVTRSYIPPSDDKVRWRGEVLLLETLPESDAAQP